MDNETIIQSFKQALAEYESVIAELNRPKRDVVMVATCELVKKSVGDFLGAFLLVHGKSEGAASLSQLHKTCLTIDPAFKELKLDTILCLDQESTMTCERCLENGWINNCASVMTDTKNLVLKLVNKRS